VSGPREAHWTSCRRLGIQHKRLVHRIEWDYWNICLRYESGKNTVFLQNVSLFIFVVNYLVCLSVPVNLMCYILLSDSSIIDNKLERSGHNLCKGFPRRVDKTPLPTQLNLMWDPKLKRKGIYCFSLCHVWACSSIEWHWFPLQNLGSFNSRQSWAQMGIRVRCVMLCWWKPCECPTIQWVMPHFPHWMSMSIALMRWAGNIAWMGRRGMCISYLWETQRERPLGRPRHRWADNIKVDFGVIDLGGGGDYWLSLAQDRNKWRALVSVKNVQAL
jgi:hypothetical protein